LLTILDIELKHSVGLEEEKQRHFTSDTDTMRNLAQERSIDQPSLSVAVSLLRMSLPVVFEGPGGLSDGR
jgi:hypothetical protein